MRDPLNYALVFIVSVAGWVCVLLALGACNALPPVKSAYDIASETCIKYFAAHPSAAVGAPGDICADNAVVQPFVDALLELLSDVGPKAAKLANTPPEPGR